MNIIVPINVQTLRVSPSTNQMAKTALYDFSQLGIQPLSGTGNMVAANNFEHAEEALNTQPGIHVHWSIPNAYLHGVQDENSGSVNFPSLPNRWVVIRFFKNLNPTPASECTKNSGHFSPSVQIWILESDAHAPAGTTGFENSPLIPWADQSNALNDLNYHVAGQKIVLNNQNWTEPGEAGNNGIQYLGSYLQAPLAYGETFTAFYQQCGNIFGLYDDLSDIFNNPNYCLEYQCNFSASYAVLGWVAPLSSDTCYAVLNEAISDYNHLPAEGKPEFADYLQEVFEKKLQWSLSDYSGFNLQNTAQAQGIVSGISSAVNWNIPGPGQAVYPSVLPDTSGVKTSIGNTNAEALSAYLNALESGSSSTDPGDVTKNTEWLLNALQYGQLQNLAGGEVGAGQLDEYIHGKSFGSRQGGFVWTVRNSMTPNSGAAPQPDVEATLPLPLAKILSGLNHAQKEYDDLGKEIESRMQKLYFDWCYHMNAIETNVIQAHGNLDNDLSRDYLIDGLVHLYPSFLRAGASGPIAGPQAPGSPYVYANSVLNMMAPASVDTNLPTYNFNQGINTSAQALINEILNLFYNLDASMALQVRQMREQIETCLLLLNAAEANGSNAQEYVNQAIVVLQNISQLAQNLNRAYAGISDPDSGLSAIQQKITADITALQKLLDPNVGLFSQIPLNTTQTVPVQPGQTYTGQAASFASIGNMGTWTSGNGFAGMKGLIDQCSAQDGNPYYISDIQLAGLYLGAAYFWQATQEAASISTPYYVQMAQQEINNAIGAENMAQKALQTALAAVSTPGISVVGSAIATLSQTTLPGILSDLNASTPNIASAISILQNLLGTVNTGNTPSIPALYNTLTGTAWLDFVSQIEVAWNALSQRLPLAQQVSILSQFLNNQVQNQYVLGYTPADNYWQPNNPVILLTESGNNGNVVKPVNRNGSVSILPCRLESEIVTGATSFPASISALSGQINPGINGLSSVLQQLAEEAFLLCPEIETLVSENTLQAAAQKNTQVTYDSNNQVILQTAPSGLNGKLPYYIAWNWWSGADSFQPLFIFWEVEYVYSQQMNFNKEQLPGNYLQNQFTLDQYLVDNQLNKTAADNFVKSLALPNYFNIYGVITLGQAATVNLCDQIQSYCKNNFNYDPASGPPNNPNPDQQQEEMRFYKAYSDFKGMYVLSQGLSGFNEGMTQRAEEMQLPINIPQDWIQNQGQQASSFWPTQMLAAQSANWPSTWAANGLNINALNPGQDAVFFNPLRAGFLRVKELTLVDAFGRYANIIDDAENFGTQPVVAETMQCQIANPIPDHPVFLPPRIVQPSRLLFKWVSADAPDTLGNFTEWNPHPAASPICGWMLPNHLDDSLMLYGTNGVPLGSLRSTDRGLQWFTVPGEVYQPGTDNRQLMLQDLQEKNANPLLQGFLENFAYPNTSAGPNLENFLQVLDSAQQFIITPGMQEDQALAVLVGQPLVLVQATLQLELMGLPDTSLDLQTYMPWNQPGTQFQMDANGFIPYNFGNFNDGSLPALQIPTRVGAIAYEKNGQTVPYFDDGLVGFFIGNDFSVLYTPVSVADTATIKSTALAGTSPVSLQPNGAPLSITMIIDPRASVHATTGVLPVQEIKIPADQYSRTLSSLLITFLTAPVMRSSAPIGIPAPAETGYVWSWQQQGAATDERLSPSQQNTDAVFAQTPQYLVDGWMKLQKK